MAHTTIVGTLGKDPEVKHSSSGKAYARMSVAWSERQKDSTGNWVDGPTEWVNVTVFGRQAENVATSLTKGTRVAVTGQMRPETWSSQNGEKTVLSMTADIVAPELTFATAQISKSGGGQGGGDTFYHGKRMPSPYANNNSAWGGEPQQGSIMDEAPF